MSILFHLLSVSVGLRLGPCGPELFFVVEDSLRDAGRVRKYHCAPTHTISISGKLDGLCTFIHLVPSFHRHLPT